MHLKNKKAIFRSYYQFLEDFSLSKLRTLFTISGANG